MSSPGDASAKETLRAQFRTYRSQLAPDAVATKSAAIVQRVRALPEVRRAGTVHCYWPLVDRGEIDTRPLICALHARGVRVVLPVVASFDGPAPTLRHHCFDGHAALRTNRWGLYEPDGTEAVVPEALDVVIVPALGAGRNGHRIGHGFGYYDAFLAPLDVPTIALVYNGCLVDAVPPAPHDVPVSVIATERECLRPAAPAVASPAQSRLHSHG